MLTITVISARGGFKVIPRENVKLLHNKSLVAYSGSPLYKVWIIRRST